jgi:hypothetical protein
MLASDEALGIQVGWQSDIGESLAPLIGPTVFGSIGIDCERSFQRSLNVWPESRWARLEAS